MKFKVKLIFLLISFCYNFYGVRSFSYFGLGSGFMYLTKKLSQVVIEEDAKIETKWIKQPLNHFNKSSNESWSMRYFENLRFFEPGSPLYFFIGGIGEADPRFLTTGLMFELAKETTGAMFATEHRYYGESIPREDLTFLDSKQALADIARLVRCKKADKRFKGSKVVVVGGSDGGNLAVWLRLIFPKKVDAVIASSAPLLATEDFDKYLVQVADNYKKFAPRECWKKIKENFNIFDEKFKYNHGIRQLVREENICNYVDMGAPENQQFFIQSQLAIFMGCAQGGPKDILDSCKAFHNISKVKVLKQMFGEEICFWNEEEKCFDYDFLKYVNAIKEKPFIRAWMYQLCNELGFFPTTTSDEQPFPKRLPPELYYLTCSILFGSDFNAQKVRRGVKYTNFIFGGKDPHVTKVIFVHGELDPWKHLGVLESLSCDAPVFIIPNVAHGRDLFSSEDDPEVLVDARLEIKNQIKMWLNHPTERNPLSNK